MTRFHKRTKSSHSTVASNECVDNSVNNCVNNTVSQSTADKPVVQGAADKPVAKGAVDKPVVQSTTDKPVVQSTADKPVAQGAADKPVAKSVADKPVVQNAADKTVDNEKINDKLSSVLYFLFLPLAFLFMEMVARISTIGMDFSVNLLYILLLSSAIGALLSALCGLFSGKARKAATIVVLTVFTVFMAFQVGYYRNFKAFFCIDQAKEAGNAISDFSSLIFNAAINVWYVIIIMFIPLVLFCVFSQKLAPKGKMHFAASAVTLLSAVVLYFSALGLIYINGETYGSAGYTYTYAKKEMGMSYSKFGFINTTRLDIKQTIFGVPDEPLYIDETPDIDYSVSSTDKEYGYNVLDIDFNELAKNADSSDIAEMHKYVGSQLSTLKNEYTGYFEGKNIIMLSLESFCSQVIDPEFTPMLYKMSTQGFVFNNYYHSLWSGSTATGEYTNLTGNIASNSACLLTSSHTYQPLTMANQMKGLGYSTHAYHNHKYGYYWRNLAYPNFGYSEYKGEGHGIAVDDRWPESDLSMAEQTVDDYINEEKFHVYYMTVSGHFAYSFDRNDMAALHEADLPAKYDNYYPGLRAYLAGQYEVELMMQYLVKRLEEAGVLDDTVFVLAADHYPYVLSEASLSVLYKLPRENILNNVELYKNSFIIWNSAMEKPVISDKYCSAIDILPTLLNLWGIDYDSRLLIGSDILSDSEGISLIHGTNGFSWKTDQGTYDANDNKFTPSDSCTMNSKEINEYVKKTNQKVVAKDSFSQKILKKNYYKYVFK